MTDESSHHDLAHRATRSAALIMLRGLAIRAIGLLGNVVLARLLLPREFGLIALGSTIVTVGDFLGDGGLASALIRQASIERSTLQAIFGFQLLVTIAVAGLITTIGVLLGGAGLVASVMVWSLVVDTGRLPNTILLERELNYRLVLQTEIAETIVWNVWAVAAVLLGAGVWGVATAQIARAVVAYGLLSWRGPLGFVAPRISWSRTAPLLKFGAKFQGFSLMQLLRDQGATIGIAAVGGLAAVGVWSIVTRLTLVLAVLLESLWRVSFPAMSRLRESGRDPNSAVRRALVLATMTIGLLVVPLGGSAPALIPVLFGTTWHAAVGPMPLVSGAVLLSGPLGAILVGYFLSEDRAGLLMRMVMVDSVALLGVGLPLLAIMGVDGLGIGSIISALCDLVILSKALYSQSGINAVRAIAMPSVAAVIAGCEAWLIAEHLGVSIYSLLASAVSGELLYVLLLLLTSRGAVTDSLQLVRRARRRVEVVSPTSGTTVTATKTSVSQPPHIAT